MSSTDHTSTVSNDRYERRELLQPGAVETWSGLDRTLNRPVTIRRATADSEIGHRLRLQAKALARVEHHGLLHILDTYDDANHFAIVTEQLPTRMLIDEITSAGPDTRRLAATEAIRIVIAVTEALAVLHSAGFAHGGVDADYIGWRAEVGWVILNGPPTDDAVTIPATRRADLASIAVLAHRLLAGAAPKRRPDGTWELDHVVPDVVAPVLARAISASDPWPDVPSMLLALRSVVDELPATDGDRPDRRSVWQAEGHWLAPVGVLLAAAATLVGVALVIEQPSEPETDAPPDAETRAPVTGTPTLVTVDPPATATTAPRATPTTPPAPTTTQVRRAPLLLESITDFDPAGDDRVEHPERLIFINDGDPTTGWSTARYNSRDFGGLKDGVGLIVVLGGDEPQPVDRLVIDSPTVGWAFEVYASRERNRTLIDWGSPVAITQDITGSTTLDVPTTDAAALLVWITDLGNELPNGGHRVTISRIEVSTTLGGAVEAPPSTDAVTR
ncbi:hypothetical protein [Candidatus Poriferisodalis sp.]|uniref:hypothetical protein n=1 Tax=Candidatus Poriferisodalis sp. TaxID=3101277 RepID=UPI003B010424